MKIQLTKNQALAITSLGIFTDTTRQSVTPVLTELELTVTNNKLTALATDRFCVARYVDEVIGQDLTLRLTRDMVKFIADNNKVKKYSPVTELELMEDGSVSAKIEYATFTDKPVSAKFPAVNSLIENWIAATELTALSLRAEFLGKLQKLTANGEKAELWKFEHGGNAYNPAKPGPLKATALKVDGKLTALIQPNLLVA